jgi:hypothetical protein
MFDDRGAPEVIALVTDADGPRTLVSFSRDATTIARTDVGSSDPDRLSLAGATEQWILVLDGATGGLLSFDRNTLGPVPVDSEPTNWISAWIDTDEIRYVDREGHLFVGDTKIPGEYVRVR